MRGLTVFHPSRPGAVYVHAPGHLEQQQAGLRQRVVVCRVRGGTTARGPQVADKECGA